MKKMSVTVTLNEKGQVTCEFPTDKIAALGMLEFAKHIVMNQPLQKAPKIQVPLVMPPSS